MIPTLTQSLLQFMLWFAVASIFGIASYLLVLRIRMEAVGCLICFALFSTVAFFPFISVSGFEAAKAILLFIGCCSPIWVLGAYAEGKAVFIECSFASRFTGLVCATALGFLSSACVAFFSHAFDSVEGIGTAGLFVGLSTTPSAVPIFLWLWHSSKSRPGIDRHLKEGENR